MTSSGEAPDASVAPRDDAGTSPEPDGIRRTRRIGLTGPIGCGKSTVAGWLQELGASIIDADHVAREATPPGSAELAAIAEAFGPGVLSPGGALDRAALGRIVFSDAAALQRLERIVHPAVRPRILAAIERAERAGAPAIVIEAIKLVEGGLAEICDEVWLVVCDPAVQRFRLASRGSDAVDTEARIAAQADLVSRLGPAASRVLSTDGSIDETRALVSDAWGAAQSAPGSQGDRVAGDRRAGV